MNIDNPTSLQGKRAVAYIRVSTMKQDIKRQEVIAREFCSRYGLRLVKSFSEKISGAKADRESFKRLLAITDEVADIVLVSELSRFTRAADCQVILDQLNALRRNGLDVIFLDNPTKLYKADEPLEFLDLVELLFKAQGAAEERTKINSRMQSGRKTKLLTNPMMVVGSQVPFGFRKVTNPDYVMYQTIKSYIVPDEQEQSAVRMCFDLAVAGNSCQRIADWLNSSGYHHKNNKGEKKWQSAEVGRMLRNRLYIGERTILGVTHQIAPTVTLEAFQAADEAIRNNRVITKREDNPNPLRGLFFCGDCGLPVSPVKSVNGELTYRCLYRTYVGRNPNKTLKPCHSGRIYANRLLTILREETIKRVKTSEYFAASQAKQAEYHSIIDRLTHQIAPLLLRLEEIDAQIDEIEMGLGGVNLTNVALVKAIDAQLAGLKQERSEIEVNVSKMNNEIGKLRLQIERLDDYFEGIDRPILLESEQAEFFGKYIERIEWTSEQFKRKGTLKIKYKNGDQITLADIGNK